MDLFLKGHVAHMFLMIGLYHLTNILISTDVVYFGFSKAFDSVPHTKLLLKLETHGITGKLLVWFRSFLMGRHQWVKVNGTLSSWEQVSSGIPKDLFVVCSVC